MGHSYAEAGAVFNDVARIGQIAQAVAERDDLDVMILSAHGMRDTDKGMAGIAFGGQFYMGAEWPAIRGLLILVSCTGAP